MPSTPMVKLGDLIAKIEKQANRPITDARLLDMDVSIMIDFDVIKPEVSVDVELNTIYLTEGR